jgi:hypothetical protein
MRFRSLGRACGWLPAPELYNSDFESIVELKNKTQLQVAYMHFTILHGMLIDVYELYTKYYTVYVWCVHPYCICPDKQRVEDWI